MPDPNFPAAGPVFEELAQVLPTLAGESRSFDANGQWFRVLGGGGTETVTLGRGLFGTTGGNVGNNPPKATRRPPLRGDVPCETQQAPDLRTQAGPGPRKVKTDTTSKAYKEREAKARAVAIEVMNRKMRAALGDKAPRVIDRDATAADIAQLRERMR